MKTYEVTISQVWSETVTVKANTSREAKIKGWVKWKPKKVNYKIYTNVTPRW